MMKNHEKISSEKISSEKIRSESLVSPKASYKPIIHYFCLTLFASPFLPHSLCPTLFEWGIG